jgi:hypothetical protein
MKENKKCVCVREREIERERSMLECLVNCRRLIEED